MQSLDLVTALIPVWHMRGCSHLLVYLLAFLTAHWKASDSVVSQYAALPPEQHGRLGWCVPANGGIAAAKYRCYDQSGIHVNVTERKGSAAGEPAWSDAGARGVSRQLLQGVAANSAATQ
jgi:hypothetical protein